MIGLARMTGRFIKPHGWRFARMRKTGQPVDERSTREPTSELDAGGIGTDGIDAGEPGTAQTEINQPNDIVASIATDCQAGLTVPQIAARWRVPEEFVSMALDRARERGLDIHTRAVPHPSCNATICRPDPTSLLCASCPFRTAPSAKIH